MKKIARFLLPFFILCILLPGCAAAPQPDIAATTLPVYEFTHRLCQGTDLTVERIVTENVSCLHEYSLQVSQMRAIETAEVVVLSGGGLEEFMDDALAGAENVIDASLGISLICPEDDHDHAHVHEADDHGHHHDQDPHIWLSPEIAKQMARNICSGLSVQYPDKAGVFEENLTALLSDLDALQSYGETICADLACRELITFHDGFSYFAQAFHLTILQAVEEESGSEASAAQLIELIEETRHHNLPAIFTETNGSTAAAQTISAETGVSVFALDMAMSGDSYFDAMYHNLDTIKEALG